MWKLQLMLFHMVIQEPERQSLYLALVGVMLGWSRLDRVDLKTLVLSLDIV